MEWQTCSEHGVLHVHLHIVAIANIGVCDEPAG